MYKINVNLSYHCTCQELIESLNKGELQKSDYACKNEPIPVPKGNSARNSKSTQTAAPPPTAAPHSMRSRRTANWAKSRTSDDGYSR